MTSMFLIVDSGSGWFTFIKSQLIQAYEWLVTLVEAAIRFQAGELLVSVFVAGLIIGWIMRSLFIQEIRSQPMHKQQCFEPTTIDGKTRSQVESESRRRL